MYDYGTPGGSLTRTAAWTTGDRASEGRKGERACAALLRDAFRDDADVYVFHDLRVPGYSTNVDHVVVKGFHVLLVDSKSWKPGRYWTIGGTTRRGRDAVPHADKQTLLAAARKLREHLEGIGRELHPTIRPHLPGLRIDPVTIVFASNDDGKVNTSLYRPRGGIAIAGGNGAAKQLRRLLDTDGSAAPCGPVLSGIHRLITDQTTVSGHSRASA